MPAPIKLNLREPQGLNPGTLTNCDLRFTDIYELLVNETSLVKSELIELHRLILKKLSPCN